MMPGYEGRWVVDTNVLVVANGGADHVDADCELRCIDALEKTKENGVILVDTEGFIVDEYRNCLNWGDAPLGNAFFKYVFENQWTDNKVRQIQISKNNDSKTGFDELPPNNLDPSDRKFLAVAVTARASIMNAADSDWSEQAELTTALHIANVEQLCPRFATKSV